MSIQANKKTTKTNNLGRGLESLISTTHVATPTIGDTITHIAVENLRAGIGQPRTAFDENALQELSESIKEKGILQPLIIRDINGTHTYEIVAGERRFRAAKMANLATLPCIIKKLSDTDAHEVALIENIQREDLDPMEEALGYRTIMDNFSYTQEEMSQKIGKSRSRIANALRLLKLPEDVQNMLVQKQLSAGHAKVLIGIDNASAIARKIIQENMSVRETERYIQDLKNTVKPHKATATKTDTLQREKQDLLCRVLKRHVDIKITAKGSGKITLAFTDEADMDVLLNTLVPIS